jgi:hypothetical protein
MTQKETGPVTGAGEEIHNSTSTISAPTPPQSQAQSSSVVAAQARIPFHPLADAFRLMPEDSPEFLELRADITVNGQNEPIILYGGKILDGRNRYRACIREGIRPDTVDGDSWIDDPAAYVISANVLRRHLDAEQKREAIEKLADWKKSDRAIADQFKSNKNTIAKLRKKAEATVPIGTIEKKRVGKDGKARKRPAKKAKATKQRKPVSSDRELGAAAAAVHKVIVEAAKSAATAEPTPAAILVPGKAVEFAPVDAEKARQLEIENLALKSEVEELKAERDRLREEVAKLQDALRIANAPKTEAGADSSVTTTANDDSLDVPTFLRRGHPDCIIGKAGAP